MLTQLSMIITVTRARMEDLRADERGYTTETVIVTALLVALAIAVIAMIVAAVIGKAQQISTQM